jgi:hypothetical protein
VHSVHRHKFFRKRIWNAVLIGPRFRNAADDLKLVFDTLPTNFVKFSPTSLPNSSSPCPPLSLPPKHLAPSIHPRKPESCSLPTLANRATRPMGTMAPQRPGPRHKRCQNLQLWPTPYCREANAKTSRGRA